MNYFVCLFFLVAAAIPTVSAAEVSIAYVNTARVLEEAPQAHAARKKLDAEFAQREAELAASQKQLKRLEALLARGATGIDDEEKRRLERERILHDRELKHARETFTEDRNLRRNEEFAKLQRTVSDTVVAVAKEGGFDLVVESGVIFASPRVDITGRVLERLGQLHDRSIKGLR